ncbi:LLM class flavin-dependent oxidoreductase [Aquibacillus sp. 3ASR75-11]|uniref:LLM class flavin-dependent oxidoreductase n=1 Tax=Terrihalobacillus insolitus TaxID=2950438 RepID=A0A9X3WNK5_9BACI|nr:LLM class flavin-dependent oxidoreductase [Terrihalobacillus insolitus]MDC3412003.1 LLM class flavin-dependent oxidoreductase [Terrihalobacillus insolitus]MDC3423312.1 LLM class flavin-dependent oxidoreductase [Terrihalobacillus insolitus]
MGKKRIYLNAFDMNCVGHQSPGVWSHPEDQSYRYDDLDYWVNLAKLLEKGKFDGIFLADVLGVYDVYKGNKDAAVEQAVQVPANDPLLLISAMAHATEHLGFGLTYSLTYEQPYMLARRFSTLDHLTKGRIAWNIVSSYLESAAKNFGLEGQIPHDERYEIAEEFLEVSYKLWEGSWEDDAVIRDKEKKVYTDPTKVHDIHHDGKYFQVPGAHLCEPSPQRTPVLYQAGASPRGREFAAKHAECVFTAGPTAEVVKKGVKDLREKTRNYGRNPEDVVVYTVFTPIVGKTEEEARKKYEELKSYVSYEGALALLGGWTGIDFSEYDPEQTLEYIESNAIQSAVEVFTKADPDHKWTIRELATFVGIGGRGPVAVGSPEQIADELEYWVNETGVDGFNLAYTLAPGSFEDFVELVIPILQERGLVQTDYEDGTYREKLFGKGQNRLKDSHPGTSYQNLSLSY